MKSAKQQGFTLLELIVSIALLLSMILLTTRFFTQISNAVEREQSQVLLDSTARQILDSVEEEISQSIIRTNLLFQTTQTPASTNSALYFISTAIKNAVATYGRDVAPLQLTTTPGAFEYALQLNHPAGGSDTSTSQRETLIQYSSYYNNTNPLTLSAAHPYTETHSSTDSPVPIEVTALGIQIYPPEAPHYIDLSIQLISGQLLQRKNSWQLSDTRYAALIQQHATTYRRRIYLRNLGTKDLFTP